MLNSNKELLPVQYESNDDPKRRPPECFWQFSRMCPHIANHDVEGEEVIADTVAAVEKDAVHPGIKEWLAFPEVLCVNQEVEQGKEEEGQAGGDHDEGEGPQALIDRHPAIILAPST